MLPMVTRAVNAEVHTLAKALAWVIDHKAYVVETVPTRAVRPAAGESLSCSLVRLRTDSSGLPLPMRPRR